jgi:lysophospholipase L1-like esterase
MRKTSSILFIALLILTTIAMSQPKPTRVIFFGDSITELGVKPGGYITKIKDELEKKGVAGQYELIGAGISGNKVYDLYLRLEDDVLSKNPDVVVIYVGVNDVWHKTLLGTGTDADKFEKFYTTIIKKLQEKDVKLILCTPGVIGERTDNSNQQDGDLNLYSQIIRNLAVKYRCSLCDLRKAFLEYNLKNNSANNEKGILTTDRVHLNEKGNQLVADLLLGELHSK